jgi:hypothetical protein
MNVLRLVPEHGHEPIHIDQDFATLGRDPSSDVHLRDASVSRQHAEIRRADDEWVIIDRNSGNGVFVDGLRTSRGVLLPGQSLQIGNVKFRVEIDRGDDGSTVILGRSPLRGGGSSTMLGAPPRGLVAATPRGERSGVLVAMALVVGGLVVMSLAALSFFFWTGREQAASALPVTPVPRTIPTVPPAPGPVAVAPTPETPRTPPPPRSNLLISTDTLVDVLVDGQRNGALAAGRLRRIEVVPGDHIVSFIESGTRHDQLVRANPNEQAVVRFSGGSTSLPPPSAIPLPPSPPLSPTAAIRTANITPLTPSPAMPPSPVPSVVPSPPPVVPSLPTTATAASGAEGEVLSGRAAATRGDFFRALLILKDVARRLEEDPKARKQLARANAYLAWTYSGLDRPEDAKAAAQAALKADPDVLGSVTDLPAEVAGLFKRRR